jgi:hypothetical protein
MQCSSHIHFGAGSSVPRFLIPSCSNVNVELISRLASFAETLRILEIAPPHATSSSSFAAASATKFPHFPLDVAVPELCRLVSLLPPSVRYRGNNSEYELSLLILLTHNKTTLRPTIRDYFGPWFQEKT